jgi:two-component system sensor histidine kinase UhpB
MSSSLVVTPWRNPGRQSGGSIRLAALRVPLALKLVGANSLVVGLVVATCLIMPAAPMSLIAGLAITAVMVHLALAIVALRPIRDLELAAERVWRGDFAVRVDASSVADDEVLRIGSMFNLLLDAFASDRVRLQRVASHALESGSADRATIARELRDSTAQHVAALLYQTAAAARDARDPEMRARLSEMRDATELLLEQVRELSRSMHPGLLDELGLDRALCRLARSRSGDEAIDCDVDVDAALPALPRGIEAALYHVAEEAVDNAVRHAGAKRIALSVHLHPAVTLEVHDDGNGFDTTGLGHTIPSRGFTSMRERLVLFDGTLEVNSARGHGTTVVATIPLKAIPNLQQEPTA